MQIRNDGCVPHLSRGTVMIKTNKSLLGPDMEILCQSLTGLVYDVAVLALKLLYMNVFRHLQWSGGTQKILHQILSPGSPCRSIIGFW